MCECIFTIGGKNETLDTANLVHVEVTYSVDCEVIDEKGYKMRKEYIKPEAELVKFVEEEDLMTDPVSGTLLDITNIPDGVTWY